MYFLHQDFQIFRLGLVKTSTVKAKVKLSPCLTKQHAMKMYWEQRCSSINS